MLELAGLDAHASEALLDAHGPHLSAGARERVLEHAAGNPLALVELASVFGTARPATQALPDGILPVTARLEQVFGHRIVALPPRAATALVIVAANDGESLEEVIDAGCSLDDLAPAVDADLIALDGPRVTFRHPIVRSTVYQRAGTVARQSAHAALARALDHAPDRRVWHRAAALAGRDEGIAAELDAAAARAQRRGAFSVAALALRRAIDLSTDPPSLGRRLMAAATLAFEMGENDEVVRLLDAAEPLLVDPGLREQAALSRDQFQRGLLSSTASPDHSIRIAMAAWGGDASLAMSILRMSAVRCWWSGLDATARRGLADSLDRLGVLEDDPAGLVVRAVADPVGLQPLAESRLLRVLHGRGNDPVAARMVAIAGYTSGEFGVATEALAIAIPAFRTQHRLAVLAHMIGFQAAIAAHVGDWAAAEHEAAEAERLATRTEQPVWRSQALVTRALAAAGRGEEDVSEVLLTLAERDVLPTGCRGVLAQVQLARGWSALGAGRHREAYDRLVSIFDEAGPAGHYAVQCWAIGDLAEAAVHSDHHEAATALVARVEALAGAEPSPRSHVALSYARALLADDERLYLDALGTAANDWPFAHARAQLAYGTWLRRHRRTADAGAAHAAAYAAFQALGARTWAARARSSVDGGRDDLTAKELELARLAATGLSNREIGQRVHLSHRTVGTHLSRSFRKLGIHNRSQLHAALNEPAARNGSATVT